jgi:hypothetical protein
MATYLSDESWVRGSCEIVREDILLEWIHWVYYKVMTTVVTPIDYMRKPFFVYSAVKVGDEWWHRCMYPNWWLTFNLEAWTTLTLGRYRRDPEFIFTLRSLIVMMRSWIKTLLVLLPNIRIKVESMFEMMLIMRCRREMRHDQPAL